MTDKSEQRLPTDNIDTLRGWMVLGDSGVAGVPWDGRLGLARGVAPGVERIMSQGAMDAAEVEWREHSDPLRPESGIAILRAAVEHEAAFHELVVDWAGAVWSTEVEGHVVKVKVPVRPGLVVPVTHTGAPARRASVRVELVDGVPTFAEWLVEDGPGGRVFDREELGPRELAGGTVEDLWDRAQEAWTALAYLGGYRAVTTIDRRADVTVGPDGTCGEVEVSAWVV